MRTGAFGALCCSTFQESRSQWRGCRSPAPAAAPLPWCDDPPAPMTERRSLWRHPDFLKLWSGQTVSRAGTQVSQLALPLVAIKVLNASAFLVGVLSAAETAPFLLGGLPAGGWVGRLRLRPVLIAADVGRGVLLAAGPV